MASVKIQGSAEKQVADILGGGSKFGQVQNGGRHQKELGGKSRGACRKDTGQKRRGGANGR